MERTMIRHLTAAVAACAALGFSSPSGAQEPDPARKAADARVNQAVLKTIDTGYKLYNGGDPAGCYRVYQGALTAMAPLLDYRADLKAAVDAGLSKTESLPDVNSRAFALRKVLDQVYAATAIPKSLWDRLGGQPAVTAVVHDLVAIAAGDPKVDFTRGGKYKIDAAGVADLEKKLVELVSATTGGPLKYEGRGMKELHKDMGITEAQFNAMAGDLIGVLDKYKVPKREKDELLAIIGGTRADIVEAPDGTAPPPPPAPAPAAAPAPKPGTPLWDRLGGEDAVKAVVHEFVVKAAADPKVDFLRGGKYKLDDAGVADLETKIVQLISATTGGPLKYEGRDMKEVHKGMGITEAQFNAAAADLVEVLKGFKVPQAEIDELIGIVATTKKDIAEKK